MNAGARKRHEDGIENPPRSLVPATSQHPAPSPPAKVPASISWRAPEKPQEQPHVQFPDDSPELAQGVRQLLASHAGLWV